MNLFFCEYYIDKYSRTANIFRICQSSLLQILISNTLFFPSPKIGANSLQTALPCNYSTCSAKRHTRANRAQKKANLLARLFFVLLILLFWIRKSYHFLVKYPLLSCVRLQSLPAILLFGRTHRIKLSCVLC